MFDLDFLDNREVRFGFTVQDLAIPACVEAQAELHELEQEVAALRDRLAQLEEESRIAVIEKLRRLEAQVRRIERGEEIEGS